MRDTVYIHTCIAQIRLCLTSLDTFLIDLPSKLNQESGSMRMAPGRGSGCYADFGHAHYVYVSINLRCRFITYSVGICFIAIAITNHYSHDWHTLQIQNNIKLNRGGSDRGRGGGGGLFQG